MTTYTGVADANGDFNIPFSVNYTGGQKITVIAEKDAAMKTIELFAPSESVGGGGIQLSGSLDNFPLNIGNVSIVGFTGGIGDYAFSGYNANAGKFEANATGLIIGEGVTSIGTYAFSNWIKATSLMLPASLKSIAGNSFAYWVKCTSLIIPNTVTSIAGNSFVRWSNATSLTIGSGITNIPASAFSGWGKATSLQIPDSVVSIDSYAFSDWATAANLTLPSTLKTINGYAFENWYAATSLTIPALVTSIGGKAFSGWSSCNTVTCMATTPPRIQVDTFANIPANCIFKVPAASVDTYKAAVNWSAYASRIQAI